MQILQIFTASLNDYLKFTGNIIEVRDRWRRGIRRCWHAGGERFEPVYGRFLYLRNPVEAVKKIFTTKNRKSYKNSPHPTLKMRALSGEKICFSPLSLHYYLTKPRPGLLIFRTVHLNKLFETLFFEHYAKSCKLVTLGGVRPFPVEIQKKLSLTKMS